ncbi:MAG: ribosome assembly RNA-binding protein YhbY [Clostridiales bacterium]
MLKGKQKSYLRSMAMTMDPIFQIGKDGIGDNMVKQLGEALEARELIKIKILRNSGEEKDDAGAVLSNELNAELVQTIGRCIVLYRKSQNNPKIVLPK